MSPKRIAFWLFSNRSVVLVVSLTALTVVALGITFYIRGQQLMRDEIQNRLRSIAISAALMFDSAELDELHTDKDVSKPVYAKIVEQLNLVRTAFPEVRYIYIMRPTADPTAFEFVADADSLHPFPPYYDLNGDNRITSADQLSPPGMLYDVSEQPEFTVAMQEPTITNEPHEDQWGMLISGYAPIRGKDGHPTSVLGVDMEVHQLNILSRQLVSPFLLLLIIMVGGALGCVLVVDTMQRRKEAMKHIEQERSGLLRLTFHQLGEPLTIMKWSVENLRDELGMPDLPQAVKEHIASMDEGLGRLNGIIDTLQQAEKVELRTMEYIPTQTDIRVVVDNAIREWEGRCKNHHIHLHVECPMILLPLDHNMIILVLRQIIQNAIDYSPDGASIHLRVTDRGSSIEVSVQDEGCGIPKKDMPHIFEKYHRASNAPLHKPDGNGLGLYIARGIVERAGGRLTIESVEGKGTTVRFSLPVDWEASS